MNPVRKFLVSGTILAVSAAAAVAAGDGKALFESKCTMCHAASRALSASKDKAGWQSTVERMKGKGAKVDDQEAAAIVDYLAKEAGK
ncbi:MAG TPA: c-type cytochrome [Candidatus Deferrimicrobiaceae bacterium]